MGSEGLGPGTQRSRRHRAGDLAARLLVRRRTRAAGHEQQRDDEQGLRAPGRRRVPLRAGAQPGEARPEADGERQGADQDPGAGQFPGPAGEPAAGVRGGGPQGEAQQQQEPPADEGDAQRRQVGVRRRQAGSRHAVELQVQASQPERLGDRGQPGGEQADQSGTQAEPEDGPRPVVAALAAGAAEGRQAVHHPCQGKPQHGHQQGQEVLQRHRASGGTVCSRRSSSRSAATPSWTRSR